MMPFTIISLRCLLGFLCPIAYYRIRVGLIPISLDIPATLMRQYVCGIKNAGEKTYNRLSKCIEDIKTELNTASF
ncbi:hypothetical protein [Prevotella bivia]|uniref:hypothetical protein n=1 Tax=Prevotella bivia TaxID=28125 RepID=UPI0019552C24|nr:hypothetical protein [Prevotella bivia]